MTEKVELAVVGAGPAGMEAAIAAADSGVQVVLI
ncbi:MAG: FAD-dependent oxidoreductase, partial [Anaerolineae bacterium]|nr:FAD-dependent oxidoreductase [Anaerolineae bacterium]